MATECWENKNEIVKSVALQTVCKINISALWTWLLWMYSSARFEGSLNVDLNEITMNLVPFPRMQYLVSSQTPLYSLADIKVPARRLISFAITKTLLSDSQVSISLIIRGLWWTVSGQVKAHVVQTCTNGVSPNYLPVIVARDRPWTTLLTRAHNKIWRWTESTPQSGWSCCHVAVIYSIYYSI